MLEFLVQRTVLDLNCSSSLLVCMTSLIYVSIVMTCLLYKRIKSYCILFINPTFFFFTLIDEFHMHSVSELALKACLWIRGVVSDIFTELKLLKQANVLDSNNVPGTPDLFHWRRREHQKLQTICCQQHETTTVLIPHSICLPIRARIYLSCFYLLELVCTQYFIFDSSSN
jgi:hypothetical protein